MIDTEINQIRLNGCDLFSLMQRLEVLFHEFTKYDTRWFLFHPCADVDVVVRISCQGLLVERETGAGCESYCLMEKISRKTTRTRHWVFITVSYVPGQTEGRDVLTLCPR